MKAFSVVARTSSARYKFSAIARNSFDAAAIALDLFGPCSVTVFLTRRSNAHHHV